MHEIIAAEFSALNATDGDVLSNLFKQICEESMKYPAVVPMIPDRVTKPFVLDEWLHSPH
ncbi:hypothetical protein [Candidatus Enterovibrio altilux]|uniref:Uncharacterized protein n=2 Tax=Candidatus Enterovibrio altilux TaxID=1927128 RepID=A0A291B9F9_9GAMM|nr:hypothetical protein [Candidatus Enterovibrio luxaltus]ATF09646.1 hypothetical protein BTN50_1155 [Candidatus Enterovibrio luxaltus]